MEEKNNWKSFSDYIESLDKEPLEELKKGIKDKIDYKNKGGFDMSGYNNSFYENMGLIKKIVDYTIPREKEGDYRNRQIIYPNFWKGSGTLFKIEDDCGSCDIEVCKKTKICDINGWGTEDILLKIILSSNPTILEDIKEDLNKKREDFIKELSPQDLEDFNEIKDKQPLSKTIIYFKRIKKLSKN